MELIMAPQIAAPLNTQPHSKFWRQLRMDQTALPELGAKPGPQIS